MFKFCIYIICNVLVKSTNQFLQCRLHLKIINLPFLADPQNGAIILYRNGYTSSSYYYGIVWVYYNNGWGNICDDYYYSSTEANVICHQLGYTGASSYSRAGLVRLVSLVHLTMSLFKFPFL